MNVPMEKRDKRRIVEAARKAGYDAFAEWARRRLIEAAEQELAKD